VFKLADSLAAAGLEVWVDRRINPGDDFRDIIRRNIRDCCAFVPVLSRNTQSDDLRWFRSEWAQAVDQAKESFGTDRAFLFPIVVDGTPMSELNEMRRDLFARSAVVGMGGVPTPEFIASLDRAQKMWRKQHA
jgi:hypothetical protein